MPVLTEFFVAWKLRTVGNRPVSLPPPTPSHWDRPRLHDRRVHPSASALRRLRLPRSLRPGPPWALPGPPRPSLRRPVLGPVRRDARRRLLPVVPQQPEFASAQRLFRELDGETAAPDLSYLPPDQSAHPNHPGRTHRLRRGRHPRLRAGGCRPPRESRAADPCRLEGLSHVQTHSDLRTVSR